MAYKTKQDAKRYAKEHYHRNKAAYILRAHEHDAKTKPVLRKFLLDFLRQHPCVDCGERDPIVLEFDHRPGVKKDFDIGAAVQRCYCLARLMSEVEKCDVRCANCHRRATYYRAKRTHRG